MADNNLYLELLNDSLVNISNEEKEIIQKGKQKE